MHEQWRQGVHINRISPQALQAWLPHMKTPLVITEASSWAFRCLRNSSWKYVCRRKPAKTMLQVSWGSKCLIYDLCLTCFNISNAFKELLIHSVQYEKYFVTRTGNDIETKRNCWTVFQQLEVCHWDAWFFFVFLFCICSAVCSELVTIVSMAKLVTIAKLTTLASVEN